MANLFHDRIKNVAVNLSAGQVMTYDELKRRIGLPTISSAQSVMDLIDSTCAECEKTDLKLANKIRISFKAVPSRQLWLNGHLHSKDRYEIIGRSLVPFELIDLIDFKSIVEQNKTWGWIVYEGSEYEYNVNHIKKDRREDSKHPEDRYCVTIEFKRLPNPMPRNKKTFRIVLDKYCSTVISAMFYEPNYGGGKGVFYENIFKNFRRLNFDAITPLKSKTLIDMLARYLIFVICDQDANRFEGYTAFEIYSCGGKKESIMLSKGNDEWIMYTFDKDEANVLAERLSKYCNSLKIIYFRNKNFVEDAYFKNRREDNVRLISIKEFYTAIDMTEKERLYIEKQALYLISLINNETIDWNEQIFENIIKEYYNCQNGINFDIPNYILEDAVNVITEGIRDYNNKYDWFHYLCAANIINRYVGDYRAKHPNEDTKEKCHEVYNFKPRLYNHIIQYLTTLNNGIINVELDYNPPKMEKVDPKFKNYKNLIMITIELEGTNYLFSFTGIGSKYYKLKKLGVQDGVWSGIKLKPIAPILYKYSYCLRWRLLKNIYKNGDNE